MTNGGCPESADGMHHWVPARSKIVRADELTKTLVATVTETVGCVECGKIEDAPSRGSR